MKSSNDKKSIKDLVRERLEDGYEKEVRAYGKGYNYPEVSPLSGVPREDLEVNTEDIGKRVVLIKDIHDGLIYKKGYLGIVRRGILDKTEIHELLNSGIKILTRATYTVEFPINDKLSSEVVLDRDAFEFI